MSNILESPSTHTLQEIFSELKFGRPAADQIFIDDCVSRLSNNSTREQIADERTAIHESEIPDIKTRLQKLLSCIVVEEILKTVFNKQ